MATILDDAYDVARQTLVERIELLRRIGVYLVRNERIDGDTFDALFDGRVEVADADAEWRPATARPRDWSSIGQPIEPPPASVVPPPPPARPAASQPIEAPPPSFIPPVIGGSPLSAGQAPASTGQSELGPG
jgi:hypothetical protein